LVELHAFLVGMFIAEMGSKTVIAYIVRDAKVAFSTDRVEVSFLVCCNLILRREGKQQQDRRSHFSACLEIEESQIGLTWSIDIISGTAKARSRPARPYESHPVSRDLHINPNIVQVRRICLSNSSTIFAKSGGHQVFSSSKTTISNP